MSGTVTEPWSLPVRVDEIGRGFSQHLEADAAVRARVAEALDLEGLLSLEADVEVRPGFEGGTLTGPVRARVVQICGVTLEPFESRIDTELDVAFTTLEPELPPPGEELGLADLDTPDVIENGVLDLGVYVVEQLALAVDPFPRKPGAVFEAPPEPSEPSPFAALAALKRDDGKA